MLTLPDAILPVLHPFATLFRNPTWLKAQILLVGAILAPGQRTVAAALRVMGRSDHRDYARYHEVLNRAVWSPRQAARILLLLLLQHLDQGDGPLVFGIDETLERRRGPKIKSLGIYRDAVRSSREPPGQGQWPALNLPDVAGPCSLDWTLLGLALSHRAGTLGTLLPAVRTPPQKAHPLGPPDDPVTAPMAAPPPLVLMGDSGYAVLDLLHCCQSLAQPVTLIARLRLAAGLYEPAAPRQPGQNGRPPLAYQRLPTLLTGYVLAKRPIIPAVRAIQ